MVKKLPVSQHYKNVTTEFGGRRFSGSFHVEGGHVHVGGAYGSKSGALTGSSPADLARRLLDELVAARRPMPKTIRAETRKPSR